MGSVIGGLGSAHGELGGEGGHRESVCTLPWHWCLQAVPEMTELLKKK